MREKLSLPWDARNHCRLAPALISMETARNIRIILQQARNSPRTPLRLLELLTLKNPMSSTKNTIYPLTTSMAANFIGIHLKIYFCSARRKNMFQKQQGLVMVQYTRHRLNMQWRLQNFEPLQYIRLHLACLQQQALPTQSEVIQFQPQNWHPRL